MPIKIIRQDITKVKCDAIVDPTDSQYSHGGGADADIHEAAGEELYRACVEQGAIGVGKAIITPAFSLPCKYVIHTVGPLWIDGKYGEEVLLRSCYKEILRLAKENRCKSLAIPLISSGTFGFPKDKVLRIAVNEISSFLLENEMNIYIVVFDKTAYSISEKLFDDIAEYIDDNYSDKYGECRCTLEFMEPQSDDFPVNLRRTKREFAEGRARRKILLEEDLGAKLKDIDESFSQMPIRKIDEKGITDAECYKKANIDRKLFSKIRSDVHYRPSKSTVLAFAISLELTLDETEDMLRKAGFALSHSNKFDIIVEYFIKCGNHNIFEINETLFAFDQSTL